MCRGIIENEGFNVQKNNGYEMEHPYSEHANRFRIFYILLLPPGNSLPLSPVLFSCRHVIIGLWSGT